MIEEDKKKFKGVLDELSNSMTRMDAERDFIKETIEAASKDFNMNKKIIRKMARVYHKNNYTDEVIEMEEFQQTYESVVV